MFNLLYTSDAVTDVSKYVYSLYEKIGVHEPDQINFDYIAEEIGIELQYCATGSKALTKKRIAIVDLRLPKRELNEDIAHEIAHIILHCGSQLNLPCSFIDLQERQANILADELLAPMYMIKGLFESESTPNYEELIISFLEETFHITYFTAKKRLDKYKSLIWQQALQTVEI